MDKPVSLSQEDPDAHHHQDQDKAGGLKDH